jgi:hypothetical protein
LLMQMSQSSQVRQQGAAPRILPGQIGGDLSAQELDALI